MILVCEILRKFDIDSLYICPLHLYTVATLPWGRFIATLAIQTIEI